MCAYIIYVLAVRSREFGFVWLVILSIGRACGVAGEDRTQALGHRSLRWALEVPPPAGLRVARGGRELAG